jgi:hypothetical protein
VTVADTQVCAVRHLAKSVLRGWRATAVTNSDIRAANGPDVICFTATSTGFESAEA